RVHVVRESRRATDARHENELLAGPVEGGEEVLDGGEDGVVPTAGAPPDLLVGLEICSRVCDGHRSIRVLIGGRRRGPARRGSRWCGSGSPAPGTALRRPC